MEIELPEIKKTKIFLEEVLLKRKSIRKFSEKAVSLQNFSNLVWACYGKNAYGKRTVPSAGATYPLEIFVVVKNVESLEPGLYHYNSSKHSIKLLKTGKFSDELCSFCLNQSFVRKASFNLIITAEFERTTSYYGKRGEMYVLLEAGHAAQNVYLEATALNLGCVAVGAFEELKVKKFFELKTYPLYILSIGSI